MNCLNILFLRFIAGFLKLLVLQLLYNVNLFAFFCIISEFTVYDLRALQYSTNFESLFPTMFSIKIFNLYYYIR